MDDAIYSAAMLCAFALVLGAIYLWRRQGPGKQVWLMLVAAVVLVANVLIWVLPPL